MAAAINNFSGLLPSQILCLKPKGELKLCFSPYKTSSQFAIINAKKEQQSFFLTKQVDSQSTNNHHLRLKPVRLSGVDIGFASSPPSASNLIKQFYEHVNEKKWKELGDYISDDCVFEDCSFFYPIEGKKDVLHFFKQLTTGMGQNVKFCIEHVCEGDEHTAGINWHLEWKERQIPFSRGCSFFDCSQEGDRVLIKKARVVTESPIKPGGIALSLLKNVVAFFDDFPNVAEWFLKSPHVILQLLLKIYIRILAPVVNLLLAGYIGIWNYMVRFLAFAMGILRLLIKKCFN